MASSADARTDTDTIALKDSIRAKARALGFSEIGFAHPTHTLDTQDALDAFVAEGRHGDMEWMDRNHDRRRDPKTLWPEVGTVISLGLSYAPSEDPLANLDHPERGIISVYARNKDYHDTLKKRLRVFASWLHNEHATDVKLFVDTAPVLEKPLAEAAGLGWRGKHTNLVSRNHGSWLFLGEVFTALVLPVDTPAADRCGRCTRCQDACPTNAFPTPYTLDARRCIAYLTIEHKGPIDRRFRALMGNRIYGCDDCLAVCPWNKFAQATREPDFLPRAELTAPRLLDLVELDDQSFRQVFAGSPIKRIGRDRFVRNVLIALGNTGNQTTTIGIMPRLDDPSPIVRGAAVWALWRLLPPASFEKFYAERAGTEQDTDVIAEWNAGMSERSPQ
ncbi:MAG: tRNA epoxyqueuosine(34) reductase QueG [Pseudomonadota bacterium]